MKILSQNNIPFKREVTVKNLTGLKGVPLRFDFGIYDKQGALKCYIEVDGEQHFKYIPYFHKTIFNFKRQQEWDRRKNKYCLLNNIPLIRIPYWDIDNITLESILFNSKYRVNSKYFNDILIENKKWR